MKHWLITFTNGTTTIVAAENAHEAIITAEESHDRAVAGASLVKDKSGWTTPKLRALK